MHAFTVEAMIGFIDSIQVLTSVGGGGTPNGDQVYMCLPQVIGKIKTILPWLYVK